MTRISTPKLDVRDLEIVLALARGGSTVRAAAALHRTQSAVSRGLALAEEKLGARLFERTARGLVPTPTGERLLAGAAEVLASFAALEADALARGRARRTRVRIACECYTAYRWLPSALTRLAARAEDLDVVLSVEHTAAPLAALVSGELDVALLTTSVARRPLRSLPLFEDEIVFVVAATHPLAARASITRRELAAHPLITSSQTPRPESRWFTRTVFGDDPPKLSHVRFPLTEAIVDAARAGMGVAVLSAWIAAPYLEGDGLVARSLAGSSLRRRWRIAFRPEASEAAARLAVALAHAAPRGDLRTRA